MRRQAGGWAGVFGVAALFLVTPHADALVTRITPLRELLNSTFIFTATVDKLDPEKPSMTLLVKDTFKGKLPFEKLPINLTADREGQREQHTAKLLKRVAPDLELVMAVSKVNKRYTAFGYTNGTWFQVIGYVDEDPAKVRWSFTHCEPYLRRTFKGTTEELKQIIRDGLANKKQPPEPDAKEPPGLGPEVKEKTKENGAPSAGLSGHEPKIGTYSVLGTRYSVLGSSYSTHSPLFAVIPTFVIIGPIAVLAALFPAIFGGLALLLRRWVVLLSVASINSTLFFVHAWFGGYLSGSWWSTQTALWGTMTVVTLAGLIWSWRRNRQAARTNPELGLRPPQRVERILLGSVSLLGVGVVLISLARGKLFTPPWREMLVIWSVAWVGAVYTFYLSVRLRDKTATRPFPASEGVMLCTLALACAGWSFTTLPRQPHGDVQVVWEFKPADRGAILSSPLVQGDNRIYIGAIHSSGLASFGAVYRVDRDTGAQEWKFDDDGGMQQVFSTPCADGGKLFIGEGLHENRGCRFFCLNADTGRELWHFETSSHTESSPCVADGRVFFGAGDDGLFCLDAATGKELWHFNELLHIDADPLVVGDRLYCGSGTSRTRRTTRIFCLDTKTGEPHWQLDTQLAAWGSPATDGKRIYFGLGNGRMDRSAESPETPAGALLCVDPSGKEVWRFPVDDAVLVRPALDAKHVYFAARDRHSYALDKQTGKLIWKQDMGSPVVAAPALLDQRLYVIASEGVMRCLDAARGTELWQFDVAAYTQTQPQCFSSPTVVRYNSKTPTHRIYFGAALQGAIGSTAALYCLEGPTE